MVIFPRNESIVELDVRGRAIWVPLTPKKPERAVNRRFSGSAIVKLTASSLASISADCYRSASCAPHRHAKVALPRLVAEYKLNPKMSAKLTTPDSCASGRERSSSSSEVEFQRELYTAFTLRTTDEAHPRSARGAR